MFGLLKRLFANPVPTFFAPSATCFYDGSVIIIAKQKVWAKGPLHIQAEPFGRFEAADLKGQQAFLVQCLTTPPKVETTDRPEFSTDVHKTQLGVRSVIDGVRRFRNVSVRLERDALVFTPTARDLPSKSWRHLPDLNVVTGWQVGTRGAEALRGAFDACK